jgi:hypothetical protein
VDIRVDTVIAAWWNSSTVIAKERAVELVEALLVSERQAQAVLPELAVSGVEEHALGSLVFWQSADYLRSRDIGTMLIGHGPYLVDGQDGSIHHIPVTTYVGADWEKLYREQIKGSKPPDPLPAAVREVASRDGSLAAMRLLRKERPHLSLPEVKAYVDAVRHGGEPAGELTRRIPERPRRIVFPIDTLAGPAESEA